MKCPRCHEKMHSHKEKGQELWRCVYCNSIWVERDSMRLMLHNRSQERKAEESAKTAPKKQFKVLHCPNCITTVLKPINSQEQLFYWCPDCHGAFFDGTGLNNSQAHLATQNLPESNDFNLFDTVVLHSKKMLKR